MLAAKKSNNVIDETDPESRLARVHKSLHYPLDVFLTCVRWYVAYPLSFVRKGGGFKLEVQHQQLNLA
jgi:hypothetical protein